ncbi:MAG: hypothetical protein EAZ27_08765 [Cytophagales bacterium]|nr:MAG: hypothetical protein EAZ27_08765 [Cytophagales bacterium]
MENKLVSAELESYARNCARKLCLDYFGDTKIHIKGEEILNFSSIKQVNYFILKIIFQKWKEEMSLVKKSSFFNYEHPDVISAMDIFSNSLSNHILIKRDIFETFLSKSIEETLYLSLSPYNYFKNYFFVSDVQKVTMSELKEKQKYLKINFSFFEEFVQKLESYKIYSFFVSDIMGHLQESYYNHNSNFDDFDNIIQDFSKILFLDLSKIVTDPKKKDTSAPTPLEIFENEKQETQNFVLQSNNITPIKLSLNQKIMFLKEIFKNDLGLMNNTMARLESAGNRENAMNLINYLALNNENESVIEFLELIEAKYK